MNPKIFRALRPFWPGGRTLRSRQKELEDSQWWSIDQLRTWQLERLKKVVVYAYEHVPYYHEKYKRQGIHPQDIHSTKDFESLPFLTREDIQTHLPELVTREPGYKVVAGSTGGSTGVPLHFYTEHAFSYWDPALELRGRGWYGVKEADKLAYVWGLKYDFQPIGLRARLRAKLLQERFLNAFHMTDENMQLFTEMMVKWQPVMFRAYASSLSQFANYLKIHGIHNIRPKLIETTAEKISLPQREMIEQVLGCKVADWYSAREMGTIAYQCPAGGLHVCETRYLEIVANDYVVEPGQMGEVVITSLHQLGMPFIRYKIGDMAVYDGQPCSCGRGMPIIKEIIGRLHEFLVATDGHFVHGGFFSLAFRHYPEIAKYQVYQSDVRHLEIRLVLNNAAKPKWFDEIIDEVKRIFGEDMQVALNVVDHIPLTAAGKHLDVISEIEPDFI